MTGSQNYRSLSQELSEILGLAVPPLAITFRISVPEDIALYGKQYPAPMPDGRTGAVSAGCVFWTEAVDRTFATIPEDHGNCSVGCMTHGIRTLEEIAGNSDVAAVCEAGWVSPEMMAQIAIVKEKPACIVYGPLSNATDECSVIVLRLNGKQQMLLHDAWPGIKLEGKPQCHIIAVAKERGEIAISVGCMLSRVRTGLSNNEVTCAIPAEKLQELIERLRVMAAADKAVASYAASDAKRFAS